MNFSHRTRRCLCGLAVVALLSGSNASFAGNDAGRGAGNGAGSGAGDAADTAMATIHPEAIRADMRFLSDDLLEGRGTATRGHELAAKFMATQFESLGLEPAGDNGTYFQNVPLRSMRPDTSKTTFTLTRGG